MKTLITKTLLAAAMAAAVAMPVGATTLVPAVDGNWNIFDVDNQTSLISGLEWIDITDGSALDFKFTLASDTILTVVDGGFAGDQFQVFDNGALLGNTSTATNSYPTSVVLDFNAALANSNYSRGVFDLKAGAHDITGLLLVSAVDNTNTPFNATVGAVSLTSVPVPGALGLFLAGSGLIGFFSRRRAN